MIKNVLFDLDGTLTDSSLGITKSVAYALDRFGIYVSDLSVLRVFIGPPLVDSFMKYFDFSEKQAEEGLQVYREYFGEYGIYENEVYEGIRELLEALKAAGKKVVLCTAKPQPYAERILEHFDLTKYFDFIAGNTMEETRSEKSMLIEYILEQNPEFVREETAMVGDRRYDIEGAKAMGIKSIGVTFGFAEENELENAGADYIVHSAAELQEVLLK